MIGRNTLPTIASDAGFKKAAAALQTLRRDREQTAAAVEAAHAHVEDLERATVQQLANTGEYSTASLDQARHDEQAAIERLERLDRAINIAKQDLRTAKGAALERTERKARALINDSARRLDKHLEAAAAENENLIGLESALRAERLAAGRPQWETAVTGSLSWVELTQNSSDTSRLASWRRYARQEGAL